MGVIIPKLRASAKGQKCTLCLPCCSYDTETTVLAHLPDPETKGMGNKGNDWNAAFACYTCHTAFDLRRYPREMLNEAALRGIRRTQKIWFQEGLLKAG